MKRIVMLVALIAAHAFAPTVVASRTALPETELVATWGCADCEGPELLGRVQDLAVTADGIVYVLDAFEPMVRRFDEDAASRGYGSEGEGPGEFLLPAFVGLLGNGAIEVIDTRARRLTRLDGEGSSLGTRPMTQFPMAADYADGGWYFAAIDWSTFGSTVKWLPDGEQELVVRGPGDFPLDAEAALKDFFPLASRPGGGYAIGDGETEYRIRVYDDTGATVADIHRDISRVRKTEGELALERERRDGERADRRRMAVAEGGAPADPPPIDPLERHFYMNALDYDAGGRLWVLTGRGDEQSSVFDLFAPDRTYLGELRLPGVVKLFDAGDGWLATSGETGLSWPIVRLWRVR